MSSRLVSGIISFLLLVGMSTLPFQSVKSSPVTITVPDDYLTIQEAINNAKQGDTVFVRNGTYDENIVVNKSLSLVGEDRDTTVIDGGGRENQVVEITADHVVVSGFTVQNIVGGYDSAGIFLRNTYNSSVIGNSLLDNEIGIAIVDSNYASVHDNYLHNNMGGIAILGSPNTLISKNKINYTRWFTSISIRNSNNALVCGNYIFNGEWSSGTALWIICSNNTSVFCNDIVDNPTWGITLQNASRNLIHDNNITRNRWGSYFENSDGNLIYHNNFINNTDYQVYMWHSINVWDYGYPCGGNYWSDYNGSDLHQGPFQNVTGSDGIGDVPYHIDENNTDNYPFMNPYRSLHAIAVERVKLERTILGEGQTTKIEVDVANCGLFTEAFNVTLCANTTIINQTKVTLTSVNVKTLTFTWDTTAFAKGNYTITATSSPVPEETCTSDNQITCWVIISMIGDITGPNGWPDGTCNMMDVAVAARAFGSYPEHPRWNLIADVNQDNNVDMIDIATVARHFGETDP